MTSGFGVDPTIVNGVITSGTTSEDIQRITGALFNPGVIQQAGPITGSSTAMTYRIPNGVVAVSVGSGFRILSPYEITTLTVTTNGSTSPRVDKIYVRQNTPALNGNSNVEIRYTSGAIPVNSVQIGTMTVPAGATTTKNAVASGNLDWSVPYGSTGKVLYRYTDTTNGYVSNAPRTINGTFYLPTDRTIEIDTFNTLDMDSGDNNSLYTTVHIDGIRRIAYATGMLTSWAQTHYWSTPLTLAAGTHSVSFTRDPIHNDNNKKIRLVYNADQFRGQIYTIRDGGIID